MDVSFIKDDDLLKKYDNTWDNNSADIEKEFLKPK